MPIERKRLGQPISLPAPCIAVTGRDKNGEWIKHLTKPIRENGTVRRIGLDPKLIDPKILHAAGHPPRSATTCVRAYMRDMDWNIMPDRDYGLKRVRELCLNCATTTSEVSRCAIINCPLWSHRLGINPHNFHKRVERRQACK